MNRVVGAVLLGLGILLLILGISASDSVGSEISEAFRGTPSNRAVWLLIGGVTASIAGVVMFLMRKGPGSP